MDNAEAVLANELSTRHGVMTRKRLMARGIRRGTIDIRVRKGRLRHVGKGVLVSPSHPATFEQRLVIACALTGGVVSFPSAGRVWQFRKTPRSDRVHIAIVQQRRISVPDWIVLHRTSALTRGDIVRRADGITVTSPPFTAFDAASMLAPDDLESLVEQGLDRENFTLVTLWALARRVCARGRPGSRRFVEVLSRRKAWRRPVDSDHELRLERALRHRGFPALTRQFSLEVAPTGNRRPAGTVRSPLDARITSWRALLNTSVAPFWAVWQRILGASGSDVLLDAPKNGQIQ